MDSTGSTVSEEVTIFDIVWIRTSESGDDPTGPGEPDTLLGTFSVERTLPRAATSSSSTSSTPMLVTFLWEQLEATFTCSHTESTDVYDDFKLVHMNETFGVAFFPVNCFTTNAQPQITDVGGGLWILTMYIQSYGSDAQTVELWAKRRVDDEEGFGMNDDELRLWELGPYAPVEDEEEEEWDEEEDEEEDW